MKRLNLLITLVFIGISVSGQIRWGGKAGLNFSKYIGTDAVHITDPTGKDIGTLDNNIKYAPGFSVGGFMNYDLDKMFSIQPELSFSLLQSSLKFDDNNTRHQNFYIQLPVNLKFSHHISDDNSIQLLAGPYIGYGLFGGLFANGKNMHTDMFSESYNKRFDVGLNFGFGYQFNDTYVISASYLLGLKKINPLDARWSSFQLSVDRKSVV